MQLLTNLLRFGVFSYKPSLGYAKLEYWLLFLNQKIWLFECDNDDALIKWCLMGLKLCHVSSDYGDEIQVLSIIDG